MFPFKSYVYLSVFVWPGDPKAIWLINKTVFSQSLINQKYKFYDNIKLSLKQIKSEGKNYLTFQIYIKGWLIKKILGDWLKHHWYLWY